MKKIVLVLMVSMMFLLTGCAVNGPLPPAGLIITNVKAPDSAATLAMRTGMKEEVKPLKSGKASATAVFGLFSGGDAGIDQAMKNGGITKVHHVEYETTMFLGGFIHSLTTIVYGE